MTGLEKMYCAMCLYKYVQYNAYRMVGLVDRGRGICECIVYTSLCECNKGSWLVAFSMCGWGVSPPPLVRRVFQYWQRCQGDIYQICNILFLHKPVPRPVSQLKCLPVSLFLNQPLPKPVSFSINLCLS